MGAGHLQAYLNEFTFRFNRRGSHARGMLFYRLLQQSGCYAPDGLSRSRGQPKAKEGGARSARTARRAPHSTIVATRANPFKSLAWLDRRICMDTPRFF